jgi:hypothetical protein
MRIATLIVAVFIILVGVVGMFTPDSLLTIGRSVITPAGLYAIAALRVGIGILLMLVAPISRVPRIFRVVGAIVVVAGIATPLFGVERSRAILDWVSTQGVALIRVGAVLAIAIGGFIAFAVAQPRVSRAP